MAAPELVDLEILSALRGLVRAGKLQPAYARSALTELGRLSMSRHSHGVLLDRCWELRDNVNPYDAAYVALAERFDVELLTADVRLANASGPRCSVTVLSARS